MTRPVRSPSSSFDGSTGSHALGTRETRAPIVHGGFRVRTAARHSNPTGGPAGCSMHRRRLRQFPFPMATRATVEVAYERKAPMRSACFTVLALVAVGCSAQAEGTWTDEEGAGDRPVGSEEAEPSVGTVSSAIKDGFTVRA